MKTEAAILNGTTINLKNDIENIGNEAGKEIKEIIENAGEAVKDKSKGIKDKLIGFCNFLRHAGVALGTALGVVAGLVAAGVVAITLPVSLPVLGAIAGGLFLGGAIVTLIHNIRDPYIKGAKNVITQTLKDIGSSMLMAIPTIISFIKDPKQIGKVINFLKTQAEDVKKDVNDLKNILEDAGNQLQSEAKNKLNDLSKKVGELSQMVENYQDKVKDLTKEGIEEGHCNIEELGGIKGQIKNTIQEINALIKGNKASLNPEQQKHLDKVFNNLNETFTDKQLDKSFQTLNESFSGNSSKEADKKVNVDNIKDEIENNPDDTIELSDKNEDIKDNLFESTINVNILTQKNEPNFGGIPVIKPQNTNNTGKEVFTKNTKTETKIENLGTDNKKIKEDLFESTINVNISMQKNEPDFGEISVIGTQDTNNTGEIVVTENTETENKIENLGTNNKKIEEGINAIVDTFNKSSFLENNYIKVQDKTNRYYLEEFAKLQGLITALKQDNPKPKNLQGVLTNINSQIRSILGNSSILKNLSDDDKENLSKIGKQAAEVIGIMKPISGKLENDVKVDVEHVQKASWYPWRYDQYASTVAIGNLVVQCAI